MEPQQDRSQDAPLSNYPQTVPQQLAPEPAPAASSPQQQPAKLHPMVVLQPGEKVICSIKPHPFGILIMYIGGLAGLAFAAVLALLLLPNILEQNNIENVSTYMYGGIAALTIFMLIVLAIATFVYWQNLWVVTTDSITQISQTSLFSRQVSQLSMEHLEDVTVDQSGILPHMFGFGTLKVESAGEKSKFQFPYCPKPNQYARQILETHELFLEERRNVRQISASNLMQATPTSSGPIEAR